MHADVAGLAMDATSSARRSFWASPLLPSPVAVALAAAESARRGQFFVKLRSRATSPLAKLSVSYNADRQRRKHGMHRCIATKNHVETEVAGCVRRDHKVE